MEYFISYSPPIFLLNFRKVLLVFYVPLLFNSFVLPNIPIPKIVFALCNLLHSKCDFPLCIR